MFTMRTSKPEKGNKFYTRKPRGYNTCVKGKPTDVCDSMANCVGFVEGRFNEIISKILGKDTFIYDTLYCNAENFIEKAKKLGLKISNTPTKGGIMVWQKGKTLTPKDGAGHVEIVEEILEKDSNGNATKIYTSASSYGGPVFFNATRTNNNGRWGMGVGYKFRGCIINPYVKEEPKPEPIPAPVEPKPVPVKPTTIEPGDIVIVNGRGRSTAKGTGLYTRNYENRKMKVIRKVSKGSHPYGLNQYAKGVVGDYRYVTAWFSADSIKKV